MNGIQAFNRVVSSRPGRVALQIGAFTLSVAWERRRIVRGARRRGRRVDARTGADPSLRQTIILLAAPRAIQKLIAIAFRGSDAKQRAREEAFQRELTRLRAEHQGDPEALQEAVMRFQETHEPVYVSCLPVLLRAVLVAVVNNRPVPFLSPRRTLADLLAGTRMVDGRPQRGVGLRWRWLRFRR